MHVDREFDYISSSVYALTLYADILCVICMYTVHTLGLSQCFTRNSTCFFMYRRDRKLVLDKTGCDTVLT